jgi:hypothetical protein
VVLLLLQKAAVRIVLFADEVKIWEGYFTGPHRYYVPFPKMLLSFRMRGTPLCE